MKFRFLAPAEEEMLEATFYFYTVHEDEVLIVAVMHHKQKPRYWIGRL